MAIPLSPMIHLKPINADILVKYDALDYIAFLNIFICFAGKS
jgi:hypothetical protein